jgi:hypothetical protein
MSHWCLASVILLTMFSMPLACTSSSMAQFIDLAFWDLACFVYTFFFFIWIFQYVYLSSGPDVLSSIWSSLLESFQLSLFFYLSVSFPEIQFDFF